MLLLARTVQHGAELLGALLQAAEGLLHVPRLNRRATLARRVEKALRELALLGASRLARVLAHVLVVLDLERLLGQGLHHLKGQEAEDVDDVVGRLAVCDEAEASPLSEALALAVGERGLTEFGPGDVFLAGHGLGALVGFAQAREGDGVHFLLFFVLLVFALGDFHVEVGEGLPRKTDSRLLVFLCCILDWATGYNTAADRIFAGTDICLAALVVRILDVLAYVLPG
jgi:hypothetical protein